MSTPSNNPNTSTQTNDAANPSTDRNTGAADGATVAQTRTHPDDHTARDAFIGTDQTDRRRSNVSWGAIFAGTVTFLALTVLLSIVTAAMGLQGAGGVATGIWAVISIAIALAVAGYIAGALAVRSGLIHGFLTWALSMLAILVLVGWLGASLLGAVGGLVGQTASAASETVSTEQVQEAADEVNVTEEDAQQAQETAGQAADTAAGGAWWTFAGALIGAVVASLMGVVGARSVLTKDQETRPALR